MELRKLHQDSRGSISVIVGEELLTIPEITCFFTRRNYARGGCIHLESWEHLCVVEGHIIYVYKDEKGIQYKNMYPGSSCSIPPNVPHYFKSVTDSIVLEWGPKISEKQDKHEEFRAIVMKMNSGVLS